jgi:hypothetical protein
MFQLSPLDLGMQEVGYPQEKLTTETRRHGEIATQGSNGMIPLSPLGLGMKRGVGCPKKNLPRSTGARRNCNTGIEWDVSAKSFRSWDEAGR